MRRFPRPPATLTNAIAYFGNQPFRSPCTGDITGARFVCRTLPRAQLSTGGVIVAWYVNSPPMLPKPPLAGLPGRPTVIDHRPAKIAVTDPNGGCRSDGGTRMVIGAILAHHGARDLMYACIHGPAPALLDEVLTSLRGVRISS